MPTSYIPFRLVHAHSSTSRRAAADGAIVYAPTSPEFPAEQAFDEPLSPDHAVSTIREPTTGILARVKHNGYTLELTNFALSVERGQASSSANQPLTITFAEKLRPLDKGCIVPYQQDGRVYIVLLSESGSVYRLKLNVSNASERIVPSLQGLEDWYEEWAVPEETLTSCGGVGAWTVIDEDTIVLGAGDGGIVRLTRSGKWGRSESARKRCQVSEKDCKADNQTRTGLQAINAQHRCFAYLRFSRGLRRMSLSLRQQRTIPAVINHWCTRYPETFAFECGIQSPRSSCAQPIFGPTPLRLKILYCETFKQTHPQIAPTHSCYPTPWTYRSYISYLIHLQRHDTRIC